ncbi:hypothetical protein KFL_009310030 [Klebsormidium nitens]|uniref:Uncharacterized protein n=1 Tax=Klebsormidium nitens TaxID=105231 RepID=A0A1Y1IV62_KLENI|nr:hypothetical protein KFL_009310030 [Klebsormidium nitens]|eukprot:GAQ92138.1 hypothetical protein KFL_009310030 [Klebsormidium nitens]
MAVLRNAAAEPRVFRRGKGAENTVVAYLGHNPQERKSRSIRLDTAAIGRTIYGHMKKSLDNGDYEPPLASPARSCSPPAPLARSPSPQLLDVDQPPSPPRVGFAEQFSKLPDVLQHLKDGTSPTATPRPPLPPKPNSLKEANEALLVSQLQKTSTAPPVPAAPAPPVPAAPAPPAADVISERAATAAPLPPPPPPMWKPLITHVALPWPKPLIADVAPAESSSPPRPSAGVSNAVRSPTIPAAAPATRLEAATPALTSSQPLPGGTKLAPLNAPADVSTPTVTSVVPTPSSLQKPTSLDITDVPLSVTIISPAVGEAPVKIKFRGLTSSSGVSSGAPVSVITAVTPASAGNHISESEPERAPLAAPIKVETKRKRRKKERRPAVDPTTGEPLKSEEKEEARHRAI